MVSLPATGAVVWFVAEVAVPRQGEEALVPDIYGEEDANKHPEKQNPTTH